MGRQHGGYSEVMSPAIQIAAAAFAVVFLVFLAYAALTEGRRRPAARPARGAAPSSAQNEADGRAGGRAFRRDALVAADDPLLGPANEEDRP